jgi:hypothetical protein
LRLQASRAQHFTGGENNSRTSQIIVDMSTALCYSWTMKNPNATAALILVAVPSDLRRTILREMVATGMYRDQSLDRSFRGSGNAAARKAGIDTTPQGCGCDVCVIYGGDCAYQMSREWVGENHRSKRGVKTRGN